MNPLKFIALLLVSSAVIFGCDPEEMEQGDLMNITYQPESYTLICQHIFLKWRSQQIIQ
ncbi:MAG: hypothetical protein IPO94_06075 [Saprospiraceae bacterium]|nr:hypothetical protein [Saprospiraceae bacterium]